MNEKEYLYEIKKMIEKLTEKNLNDELKVVNKMVNFRISHSTPELQSLKDVFYFLCGIMFAKGLSDYWNGRDKGWASDDVKRENSKKQDQPELCKCLKCGVAHYTKEKNSHFKCPMCCNLSEHSFLKDKKGCGKRFDIINYGYVTCGEIYNNIQGLGDDGIVLCKECKQADKETPKGCGICLQATPEEVFCGEEDRLCKECKQADNQAPKGCSKHIQVGYNNKLDCPINNQCGMTTIGNEIFLCDECKVLAKGESK